MMFIEVRKEMIKGKNYEITAKNILGHEVIGLKVKVVKSTDEKRVGAKGIIVDETKNTFVVKCGKEKVTLPKNECEFEFDLDSEKVLVNGKEIMKRAEERAKEWKN
ncbi:Ribonuclease P protein component 1 [uncultured archaeon]|nr:Ribonuclease P protein component 1 [uncultured archaeon]